MSEHSAQMAVEAGMPMTVPERMPSLRRALEAAEFARKYGRHEQFYCNIFRKFYGEGRYLHDWNVLQSPAIEAGLDPEALVAETSAGLLGDIVDSLSSRAKAISITAVPAFILDLGFAILGVQPLEVFRKTIERLSELQNGQ